MYLAKTPPGSCSMTHFFLTGLPIHSEGKRKKKKPCHTQNFTQESFGFVECIPSETSLANWPANGQPQPASWPPAFPVCHASLTPANLICLMTCLGVEVFPAYPMPQSSELTCILALCHYPWHAFHFVDMYIKLFPGQPSHPLPGPHRLPCARHSSIYCMVVIVTVVSDSG